MSIGDRIKLGARAKGLSLAALGKLAGIKRPDYLYRLSGPKADRAGTRQAQKLAKALGCSVEWLTLGTGAAPSWAQAPSGPITRKEPFAEALTLLGTVMKSVTEEGRRRDLKVDGALEALETARMAIERL